MKGILFVHPPEQRRERIISTLNSAGFKVVTVKEREMGIKKLYETRPDLIIIAYELPQNAQRLCSRIRESCHVPIIVLGNGEEIAKAMMLELGADFHMNEPVSLRELVARVHSLLRRYNKPKANPSLDPETNRVEMGGRTTELTPTEFRLFSCLAFNEGKFISYPQIISGVWGNLVSLDSLHFHVRCLKQKLGIDSVGPYRLLNYRGEGYCFSEDKVGVGSKDFNG